MKDIERILIRFVDDCCKNVEKLASSLEVKETIMEQVPQYVLYLTMIYPNLNWLRYCI